MSGKEKVKGITIQLQPCDHITGDEDFQTETGKKENMINFRCADCSRLLVKLTEDTHGLIEVKCPRCKHVNEYNSRSNVAETARDISRQLQQLIESGGVTVNVSPVDGDNPTVLATQEDMNRF